jgi:hypothetical protein
MRMVFACALEIAGAPTPAKIAAPAAPFSTQRRERCLSADILKLLFVSLPCIGRDFPSASYPARISSDCLP